MTSELTAEALMAHGLPAAEAMSCGVPVVSTRAGALPEVVGERNFVFTGCYTSQARQKWANRHGENILYAAEAAATIGAQAAGLPADSLLQVGQSIAAVRHQRDGSSQQVHLEHGAGCRLGILHQLI